MALADPRKIWSSTAYSGPWAPTTSHQWINLKGVATTVSMIRGLQAAGALTLSFIGKRIGEKGNKSLVRQRFAEMFFFKKTVASEMKLPVKREENLLVYTFGSRTPIQTKYEVVEITLCNLNDSVNTITIEALLTDVISGTPFKVSANKLKKSLSCKNVHFSDLNESNGDEISLLIGAQYFWQIHSGKRRN
ncbi:reverse transcriptase domain-containing protein [Trichonephila clavipes]|nr:reverse transcriptase domain-containing protein [Trichonephila clavipes]